MPLPPHGLLSGSVAQGNDQVPQDLYLCSEWCSHWWRGEPRAAVAGLRALVEMIVRWVAEVFVGEESL